MKLTMRKYDYFGTWTKHLGNTLANDPAAWDKLRTNEEESLAPFALPVERSIWQKQCESDSLLSCHAQAIVNIVVPCFQRVNSYGVGRGCLEYLIKKTLPGIFIQCSDSARETVTRLKRFFFEADEIISLNLLEDKLENDGPQCLYLFYRLDTEFTDGQWKTIFSRLSKAGIDHVLFFPAVYLDLKKILKQQCKYFICWLLNRKMIFSGYLRTEHALKSLFSEFYKIDRIYSIDGHKFFLLKK